MTRTQEQEKLNELLIELFQLDKTDLDFGIYRILNIRANDVQAFIDTQLPQQLNAVISRLVKGKNVDVTAELNETTKQIKENFGIDVSNEAALQTVANFPLGKKYTELKEKSRHQVDIHKVERAVYNDLYNFFSRYYEEGDFISMPRAGEKTYLIPYNGEEVKFHWANRDQYYIKTGENFKNYVFNNGINDPSQKTSVEFRLVEAETALNNNQAKKGRLFIPIDNFFEWNADNRVATIKFEYKVPSADDIQKWGDKQTNKSGKGINESLLEALNPLILATKDAYLAELWKKQKPVSNRNGKKETPLSIVAYHLNRYTAINAFDYFIHKRLGDFLKQELDFYIKNEVLSLSFLNADLPSVQVTESIERNIYRATAVRDAALHIIDFLAELEEFQKRLFEKKKFVVQADYCLTLDNIQVAGLKKAIFEHILSDKRQMGEWVKLGFMDTPSVCTLDFLENNPFLVLDTAFLNKKDDLSLKYRLLSSIKDLDAKTNGILFNSENWQALNFLKERFRSKIKAIYIDPPYNTAASEIIYKNSFKHSSWLSLIYDRINLSKELLDNDGISCVTIDDFEFNKLKYIIDEIYSEENLLGVIPIRNNPSGRSTAKGVSIAHEYALFYSKTESASVGRLDRNQKQLDRYDENDGTSNFEWVNFRKHGGFRKEAPTMYFPFYVTKQTYRVPKMVWDDINKIWDIQELPNNDETIVYPIDENGQDRRWKWGIDRVLKDANDLKVDFDRNNNLAIYVKSRLTNEGILPLTWWDKKEYSATAYGTNLLRDIFTNKELFSYPKSVHAVEDSVKVTNLKENEFILDYFGGSGTTAHAVINLNREDEGNRRYILVEMGEYFDTVTKPRVQKVIYSDKWKDGKPQADGKGISQIFQYLKLEQYEDTLNNIDTDQNTEGLLDLLQAPSEKLRYWLQRGAQQAGSPALLRVAAFQKPFDYQLDVIRQNERQETAVDLVTTFNYLLGIEVTQYYYEQHQARTYVIVTGKKRGQTYCIIWRNYDGLDLEQERHWITQGAWWSSDALKYCNVDNAFGASNTEGELKRLMFEEL
jgi:adenine-specific DNA-methyltransferase